MPVAIAAVRGRTPHRAGRCRFARPEPERRVCARDSGPSVPFYRSADEARCAQRTEYLDDIATLQDRALLPLCVQSRVALVDPPERLLPTLVTAAPRGVRFRSLACYRA